MRIAAVGDIHGEENVGAYAEALRRLDQMDLFLLAGDMTDHNDAKAFENVMRLTEELVTCPIYGVFGNNEYVPSQADYERTVRTRFLKECTARLTIDSKEILIVGSTGSLDRPTWWQKRNLPGIEQEYRRREREVDKLLSADGFRILLMHYPPTFLTMGAEKEEWRPELGSVRMEKVLMERKPELVVHGHVHKGIPYAELKPSQLSLEDLSEPRKSVRIWNVSWHVVKDITVIRL